MENTQTRERIYSIDDFRGVAVILMFLANFIYLFTDAPPLLFDHARSGMVLPLDLVAPFFGFALGVSFPFLRDKFEPSGFKQRIAKRVILLYIIGKTPHLLYRYILVGEDITTAFVLSWSILETWAFSFILAYLLIGLNPLRRILFSAAFLAAYQALLLNVEEIRNYANNTAEGGLAAVLSWTFIIVLGTVLGDMIKKELNEELYRKGIICSIFFIASGLILHLSSIIPMERLEVSASYILFSSGISVLLFLFFHFKSLSCSVLIRSIGKYPLQAWLLQGLFYVPIYLTVGSSYFNWPLGGGLAVSGIIILSAVNKKLLKAGISIKV